MMKIRVVAYTTAHSVGSLGLEKTVGYQLSPSVRLASQTLTPSVVHTLNRSPVASRSRFSDGTASPLGMSPPPVRLWSDTTLATESTTGTSSERSTTSARRILVGGGVGL